MLSTPTPARAAGLRGQLDNASPRLHSVIAGSVIVIAYLMFFGVPTIYAIHVNQNALVLPESDYSSFSGMLDAARRGIELCGATLLLFLVCQWLKIDRNLAGLPNRAAPTPALATLAVAAAGMMLAGTVKSVLDSGVTEPNAAAGGVVDNAAAVLALVGAGSAGVVEEIVLVAVPVLVGRRAGWHPVAIVLLAMILRVPFHLYHGWSAVPWAMIWGGANTMAYLYLRRLIPLIAFHAWIDAQIELQSAFGQLAGAATVLVGYLLVVGLSLTALRDRRRWLNSAEQVMTPQALDYARRHNDPWTFRFLVLIADVAVLLVVVQLGQMASLWILAPIAGLLVIATTVALVSMRRFDLKTANVLLRKDDTGSICGLVRWRTTYTGDNSIESVVGDYDIIDAIVRIARSGPGPIVVTDTTANRERLKKCGYTHHSNGRASGFLSIHLRIPSERAADLLGSDHSNSDD